MRRRTALISDPDGFYRITQIDVELATLQKLVDGYIEALSRPGWLCYFNEEGKLKALGLNGLSTLLVDQLIPTFAAHDVLVGPVVWLGQDDQGNEINLSLDLILRFAVIAHAVVTPDKPITVIRYNNHVYVFDQYRDGAAPLQITELVSEAETNARNGTEFGVIEVVPGISPGKWVELRVEIMDHPEITLHDEREDRSYG